MPDELGLLPQLVREDVLAVALGPGSGEDEDGELHALPASTSSGKRPGTT